MSKKQTKQVKKPLSPRALATLIDNYGAMKAAVADLQKKERELREKIIEETHALGIASSEGHLFRVNVTVATSTTVNWRRLALDHNISTNEIEEYSSYSDSYRVSVSARKTDTKA